MCAHISASERPYCSLTLSAAKSFTHKHPREAASVTPDAAAAPGPGKRRHSTNRPGRPPAPIAAAWGGDRGPGTRARAEVAVQRVAPGEAVPAWSSALRTPSKRLRAKCNGRGGGARGAAGREAAPGGGGGAGARQGGRRSRVEVVGALGPGHGHARRCQSSDPGPWLALSPAAWGRVSPSRFCLPYPPPPGHSRLAALVWAGRGSERCPLECLLKGPSGGSPDGRSAAARAVLGGACRGPQAALSRPSPTPPWSQVLGGPRAEDIDGFLCSTNFWECKILPFLCFLNCLWSTLQMFYNLKNMQKKEAEIKRSFSI